MEYAEIYKCFCEFNRLRILNLLIEGPLCVCHIHEILKEPQPKVSRLLNDLKEHGGVESARHLNWAVYRLPPKPHPVLAANLKCLSDERKDDPRLRRDLDMRDRIIKRLAKMKKDCPLHPGDDTSSGLAIFGDKTVRLFCDDKA
jgi:ArsR family transcriptional regulator, arsenate/arsenite/antimonite-responsive transcriptional repressor